MDVVAALRTTGAVRGFTDDSVGDEVVEAILDDARFAPSGGNQQPWRVAVVKDASVRRDMAALMRPVWEEYAGAQAAGKRAFAFGRSTGDPPVAVPNALIDQIETVPVVLAVAADLRKVAIMDGNVTHRPAVVGGASIYPFCWSILLAARARGLGGVLTTFLARAEAAAAPLLALPDEHALVATIFLGVPTHQNTKLRRRAVSDFTTVDRFDGEPFRASPPEPVEPSTTADERTTLVEFLDYFRNVVERKVAGLDEHQVRIRVAASSIDLLGLVRHLAEVERWWFRQVFTAEVDSGIFDDSDPDIEWHHTADDTLEAALTHWRAEVARAREIVAAASSLDTIGALHTARRSEVSLRWIVVHMIEEYARHCGHADLIREAIDGAVGD